MDEVEEVRKAWLELDVRIDRTKDNACTVVPTTTLESLRALLCDDVPIDVVVRRLHARCPGCWRLGTPSRGHVYHGLRYDDVCVPSGRGPYYWCAACVSEWKTTDARPMDDLVRHALKSAKWGAGECPSCECRPAGPCSECVKEDREASALVVAAVVEPLGAEESEEIVKRCCGGPLGGDCFTDCLTPTGALTPVGRAAYVALDGQQDYVQVDPRIQDVIAAAIVLRELLSVRWSGDEDPFLRLWRALDVVPGTWSEMKGRQP